MFTGTLFTYQSLCLIERLIESLIENDGRGVAMMKKVPRCWF